MVAQLAMNRVRVKFLVEEIRAVEKEVLLNNQSDEDRDALSELKTAVDNFRLTVWSSLVHPNAGPTRQQHVQTVRMARVVEMLRQINRGKRPTTDGEPNELTFSALMRVAEEALTEFHKNPN